MLSRAGGWTGGAVLATLLVLIGSVGAHAKRPGNSTAGGAATSSDHRHACKKDTDCVLVPDDCCSCTEGGKQHAIAKTAKATYEKERQNRCAGTMCPQMMSQDPSCTQEAICRAGTCQLGGAT